MSLDAQRAYYDRRWSDGWLDELDSHQAARLREIERALALVRRAKPPPWRILEAGCGIGWLSGILAGLGRVTAIDLSAAGVSRGRERFPEVEFEARDIFERPFAPKFDLVVSSEVIEHVENQARLIELLAAATRPGGYLLVTTPNGRVEWRYRRRPDWEPQPIERWLRPEELRELLRRVGSVPLLTTFFFDFDRGGVYDLINDPRYEQVVRPLRAEPLLARLWGRLGLGLYTIALARRHSNAAGVPAAIPAGSAEDARV